MIIVGDRVVDPNLCNHNEDGTPEDCHCFHDWRITWGNVPKQPKTQSRYVTDSP